MRFNNTVQNRVIREELCAVTTHPTAEDIFCAVRRRLPRISRGTVYRNLDKMSEAGIILCIESAGRQRRYDGTVDPHLHMRCTCCGAVSDLMLPFTDRLLKYLDRTVHTHAFTGVTVEFSGQCENCKKKTERPVIRTLRSDRYSVPQTNEKRS